MSEMHLFIINPKSFWQTSRQDEILARINTHFHTADSKNYYIHISRFPRDAVGFIPSYAKTLPENTVLRVYAVGGDGILFDCLNGIMNIKTIKTVLGAIPFGRTNNFLRGFGKLEYSSFTNISRQVNAPAVPMDIMRCTNNYALNCCTIGLVAEVVRQAERIRQKVNNKNNFKQWLYRNLYTADYFYGGISAALDNRQLYQDYEVSVDDKNLSGQYAGFNLHNGPYYGGYMHTIRSALPNDGILNMLLIRGKGFFRTVKLFPYFITGRCTLFPRNFTIMQGHIITIRSKDTMTVCLDDNTFFENEINIELLPSAINFIDASRTGYRGVGND